MRIVGVDEAGRGPVLGPLVVGILSIPEADEAMLVEQDISDSKHASAEILLRHDSMEDESLRSSHLFFHPLHIYKL